MKLIKKSVSILLSSMMIMGCTTAALTANASTGGQLCSKYATNPGGKTGVSKTITIDGDASDWSEDMLIAQGAAWDVANHYKGGHENCVLDTYALFATWDNDNLYVGWQMVNTTDTWARSGDGPLSDGGRVLDVPLILALSVDPSSTSMSNKNTSGNPIWGQKMGLEFNQHVDHLFYMSGKPGLGTPAMFTAVDANGNTDYTTGCTTYKSAGIEYKMAETNICSSIWGLNASDDPSDVYSDDADWVDYKTFKGSSGTHDTKYDSFYEMKIPLSVLGIDKNYIETNGIGAMLVATRGESGLDCIPFDDTMLDNATGDYSSDPSTSAEKDDVDTITSEFARIGKGGVTPTQPTTTKPTQPTTVQPTTVKPTTQPVTEAKVEVKSNIFAGTQTYKGDGTFTVDFDLESAMKIVNGQWKLTYDSDYLTIKNISNIMPYITNGGMTNSSNGTVYGAFSDVSNMYDFTSKKPMVSVTFDVKKKLDKTVNVNLELQELSVGYSQNGTTKYGNVVKNGVYQDITSQTGFANAKPKFTTALNQSGSTTVQPTTVKPTVQPTTAQPTTVQPTTVQPTQPVSDSLTVNASSNLNELKAVSRKYSADKKQVTVSYKLKSTMQLVNCDLTLTYDAAKLKFNASNNLGSDGKLGIAPNLNTVVYNIKNEGKIKLVASSLDMYDFRTEKDLVKVTFDIIGNGTTDVNLYVKDMAVGYIDSNTGYTVNKSIVNDGTQVDVTGTAGFTGQKLSGSIELGPVEYILYGDVDGDGEITVADVTLLQQYVAGDKTLDEAAKLRSDVNCDGVIDVLDCTSIQLYIAGDIPNLGI